MITVPREITVSLTLYYSQGGRPAVDHPLADADVLRHVLEQQQDEDSHDRSLIIERLARTPQQRLEDHAAFLRFYFALRPSGPLIRDE